MKRSRTLVVWGAFALGAALMLLTPGNAAAGLLYLLPALLLSIPLLAQRYPGERALTSRMSRSARRRPPRRAPAAPRPVAPQRICARGALLLARSLATRPPPRGAVLA